MTAQLRLDASVNVDGKGASAELQKLVGNIAATKVELLQAKTSVAALSAEFRKLNRDTEEGAARAAQLKEEMRGAQAALFEAQRAAAAAEAQYDKLRASQGGLGAGAGQTRASMANLGQQIGDVTQGLAAGVPITTIYAQQIGQVAFAASGLGGRIGAVATFLSGPWGAAITGATVILGSLWAAHSKAAEGAELQKAANEALKKATEEVAAAQQQLDQITGRGNRTLEEAKRLTLEDAQAKLASAQAIREGIKAQLDAQIADRDRRPTLLASASGAGATQGAQALNLGMIDNLRQRVAEQDFLAAGARLEVERLVRQGRLASAIEEVKLKTDAAAAADAAYEKKKRELSQEVLTQAEYTDRLLVIEREHSTALERIREQEKLATAASSEHNKELRAQEALLLSITRAYQGALTEMDKFSGTTMAGLAAANDAARDPFASRPKDALASAVDAADNRLASRLEERAAKWGQKAGDAFNSQSLSQAVAIGQTIGGTAGGILRTAAGFAQGAKTGNFTGIGTPFGGVLTLLSSATRESASTDSAFLAGMRKEFRDLRTGLNDVVSGLGRTLGKVFSINGAFGQTLGQLAGVVGGGAAIGAGVAEIGSLFGVKLNQKGAAAGGAAGAVVGSLLGGPIGGAIVGSVLGGLIKGKNPYADARLSTDITGVTTDVYATRGDGSAGTGNTIAGAVRDQLAQIASALGADIASGRQLGSIGFSGSQYYFNPTGGDFKGAGVQKFGSAEDAVAAAVANALSTGTITASPRVQAALVRYAGNVNTAVAEALKVKGLEDLLASRDNPFTAAFQSLERQLKQRVDVARAYGFDLVEIEKINAEDRAKALKDTLASATGGIRTLLNDLKFGSRATGSPTERLASLSAERDRLAALVRGGDTSQVDAVAQIVQQIDDLQKEAFGATGAFAQGRADSLALLNELFTATEDRVKAAADAAKVATQTTNDQLKEANGTLEDQYGVQRQMLDRLGGIEAILGSLMGGAAAVPSFARAQ